MNKIFKVIWSKSKQCYIVVSEMAKNKTGKKKIIVAGIFATLALIGPLQSVQAVDGTGNKAGFSNAASGVNFNSTQGLAIGLSNGDKTSANGNVSTVAIGAHSNAKGSSSVAIGGAVVDGAGAIGLGWSTATGDNAVALGGTGSTSASGNNAFAASGGNASGNGSIAVGWQTKATNNATAVGSNAQATGNDSVAVGKDSKTADSSATAIGSSAQVSGRGGVAVGWKTESAVNSVAAGYDAKAKFNNTVAIGVETNNDNSISNNFSSVSIGVATRARAVGSMALGVSADASGKYSIALGSGDVINDYSGTTNYPKATGEKAIAIGYNSNAGNTSVIAIGSDAVADKKNAVAFGSGSNTSSSATAQSSTTIGGKTYSWNKGVLSGADLAGMQVSVGKTNFERQIKNVAAGEISANSTDAINGAQLYSVASGLAKDLKISYVSINSAVKGAGSNVNNDGATGPNSIAIGPSSSAIKENGVAIGNGAKSLSEESIVIGRNAQAETKVGAGLTNTSRAIAIGSNSRVAADVTQGIAIGSGSLADEGAVVTGDQSIAIGGNVKVEGHAAIAIGGDDARKAGSMPVTYTNTNNVEVTGTLQSAVYNLTGYNLTKYKGTAASHAGVAYGTSALAGNAGVAIGTASDSMTRTDDKGQVVDNKPVTNAVAIGTGARANFDNSVAIGGGSNTDHYATKQVNAIIDGVEVKWAGGDNIAPGDVVSFGAKGFERQLKNVAPGEVSQTSTDAVNGSQIYSLARKVTNIMNGGAGSVVNVNASGEPLSKVVTGTGTSKFAKYYRTVDVKDDGSLKPGAVAQTPTSLSLVNIDQTDVNQQTQVPRTLGNVANGVKDNDAVNVSQLNAAKIKYFSVNSTDAGNKNNDGATGADAIAIGPSAVSNDVGSVALGKDAKANGAFTVALGGGNWQFKGAQANGVGTTALGSNTKTQANTNYQTAIGFGATTGAESALALGYNASASAQNAIALGKGASTAGQGALAFGVNSQANGESALAMGFGAQANSGYAVSLGYQANNSATNNANGVSIGWAAGMQSNGSSNVGIGTGAGRQISGNNNVSIGNGAGSITGNNVYTSESIMLGSNARAVNSSNSQPITNVIAIGNGASGGASSAIALGQGASSTNQNSIAIGTNASASSYNGVAIGAFSVADTKGGIIDGYNANTSRTDKYAGLTGIALKSSTGAVSIGNGTMTRQIVNLAAGTADTDAVNVAQLKSVNLAFKGNTGTGDVNLAANPLTIKGNDNYITTNASGNSITISTNQKDIHVVSGIANADSGVADAKNVATAINNAIQSNAYKWRLTANGEATPEIISKDDTVDFSGDTNISVARNGKKITTSLKKDITVDTVKANKSVTIGTGSNQITLDGNSGAVTGRTFSGNSFAAGNNVLSNTTLQIGSPTGANNVSITTDGLTAKAGAKTVKFGTNGIDASGQQITNVSSGGNVGTNAANITDVQNAVSSVSLNLDTNSKTGSVNLKSDTLKITGANGIRTDLIGTGNRNLVIGLDQATVNATTKGIGLTGDTGSTGLKYLKDGDATFKVYGDGNLVTTKASATGIQVAVDTAKVKDLAVNAVTVSKANTADNPITVTPTAGTNSKDYAIGIDTTKLAAKTNLAYTANGATAKTVSLSKGLNFVDGTNTVSSVDSDGKVSFDLNKATQTSITNSATAVGRTITLNADSGTGSSQSLSTGNVSFAVSGATGDYISTQMDGSAVKVSTKRATINSNASTGEASVTGNDGLTTAKNVADAINNTNTVLGNKITKNTQDIATNTTNIAHTIALADDKGASTTAKSLKDGNVSFNIKGDNKFISTAASGNDVTLTVNEQAIKDTAKAASSFKVKANTHAEEEVKGGDTIAFNNGDNIEITQTGKTFTIGTAKNITVDSVTAGNTVINTNGLTNGTTAITGTGITTDTVTVGGLSIDKTNGINAGGKVITNVASGGTTDTNAANIGDVKQAVANLSQNLNITDGTNNGTVDLKNQKLNVAGANGVTATVNNQTITVGLDANTVNATTKGIGLTGDTGSTGNKYLKDGDVSFAVTGDGSLVSTTATAAGVKVAVNAASITAGTDGTITGPTTDGVATAKNVADAINAAKKASKTEIKANTGEAANATKGNVTLTSTTAADGHTIYDVKLNDKVTLGSGANAVTIDGTAGKATIGSSIIDGVNNTFTTGGTSPVTLNGATGTITGTTANIGGVTVNGTTNDITGLSNTTVNAADFATKGRAATEEQLKAATGATTLKFVVDVATNTGSVNLKDDTFGIKGDGKYISTDVNGKNVNLTVSEAEVKKSAVAAVTVSTDTTDANNPLTVTPTTSADGTTKDYKVTIDGTKIANKTNLSYKANNGTAKQVSLADGLDFTNGTLTTASIDNKGVVKYDVNTATITAGADGTITGPKTDGVATAKNVADAINAAKKASKTEITANTGEAANATKGNVTLTSTTAADGHTIYDVKLNDKVTLGSGANAVTIDGTAGKATIGSSIIDGVNNTFTTGGTSPVTLNGATGTITGTTANIGGITVNGTTNDITGLSNTTVTGADFATKGRAATEEQLKAVGEQTWQITADKDATTSGAQTGTKKDAKVGKDDKVQLIAGENLTVNQKERDFTFTLNKDLVKMNSATFLGTGTNTTVITGDSITQTAGTQTNTSTAGGNTVADGTKSTKTTADGQVIKDGAKSNKSTVDSNVINDGNGNVNTSNATSNTITDGTNTSAITAGKATIGSSVVDGVNNTFTTGGANAVKLDGAAGTIKTGTVTVTGGTTNDITGLSNTTVTGADFATKGRAATEEQLKAVGEQTWQITADKDATTSGAQTGTKKDAKVGKDDKVQLIAGENLTVNQNERDFTYSLNKDLVKMNSATFEATGGKTTVIKGDSIVQTDGTKVNTSNATSNTITDGTNTSTITAGKATIGTVGIDGIASKITTGGANAVVINGADGTVKTGTVTVTGGTTNDITGLSNTTVTGADFATKGRAATEEQLKAATGATTLKFVGDVATNTGSVNLKDDTFGIKGDGKYISTDVNGKNVNLTVSEAEVKKSAVAAVTVSTDTTDANNPLTVTPTTSADGTTKDYKVTIDGTKIANKTNLSYKANNGTAKQVSLADGLDFTNGTLTTASIDNKGVVKYDVNTATITAGADGTITGPKTDGVATAKNVADAINAAKKASKTEITANTGEAANATKGNVTLTSTTAADGHTIYDVKLNDKVTLGSGANAVTIDGTAGKATIGSSIIDGVNNTFTTGGTSPVTLNGATGTITGTTANIGGVTVNGTVNDITGLSNTTVTGADFATKGRAATEEQLKAVGEQTWQITADKDATTSGAQTGTKKDAKVGKDDKVQLIAGENLTVNQNERDFTYSLNKDLVKMNSATFEATGGKTTVIKGDSIVQTDGTKTNTATAGGNTVADGTKSTETTATGQVIKDGAKTNTSTVDENTIVDGTKSNKSTVDGNTITDGTNTTATTSSSVTVKDNAGNSTVITKDNITTGVGGNKITLDGTAGKATIGSSVVDGVNNTFTTGGTNTVKLDGAAGTIKTGTVTVTGGTTNDITGLSNTTVNSADFATKGRAATEEQLKAVGEQTWQITADKDAATSGVQTGTKKDAKVGKDNKVQLIAGENMTINQNERDFTFTLNKDLVKMNSATFLGTGSNTTVITGNSITQTAGTQTNTSTATSNTITDGTNTSTVTAGKANIGNVAVDGVNNKITMGNGANSVTLDGANGHLDGLTNTNWVPGVTKATTGRAATEDQLQQVSDAVGAGWKVNTGTVAGSSGVSNGAASTKVSSGEEVKLQAGDNLVIDQNGKTVSYSLNKDLTKMNSATFEATGGKTTVIKGDSIAQTDGGKTNTSTAAGNTVVDGNKSTATTAAGTTITDGTKTNTSTADKNVIDDGAGNKSTFTKDGITITKTGKDTVSLTSNGLDNGNNKIVNVADGTAAKDAVNVSQLDAKTKAATTELTANGGQSAGNTTGNIVLTKTTAADGHTIYDNKLNDKITLGAADPTKAITVDGTAGTIKAGKDGNAVAINGTNGTVKAGDGTNAVVIDGVNGSVAVADKITLNGKDGKAGIGTVGIDGKDGIITTGGTNSVKVDGSTGTVTGLTNKTWTPGSIVSGRAATEDQLKDAVADSGWKATIGTDGSGQSHVVGTSPEKIKAEETVTFKAGNNMVVTQDGKSISYAVNPELTDMKSATFKDAAGNTTVTNGNGMTITPGSANPTNPNAGPVSLTKDGLNNGNNQIKGVAPGTDPTDAVNVGQLNASNASTSQAINQVAAEVQRVGAHAAAMAALKPIQYDPLEPTQVMAGVGNYRGETAAALGLAHYTNENTMFNVGVSVGGNHNMVNAGVTHKFGYSPEKKNIPDRYKAGPISSVYVMQDEVSSLKKENAEQKYVIADQAARLTTLEAENEQQRRELAETKKGLDDLKAAVDKLLASKG